VIGIKVCSANEFGVRSPEDVQHLGLVASDFVCHIQQFKRHRCRFKCLFETLIL